MTNQTTMTDPFIAHDGEMRESIAGDLAPYIEWGTSDLQKMELARDVADRIIHTIRQSIYNDIHDESDPDPLCIGNDPCICGRLKAARADAYRLAIEDATNSLKWLKYDLTVDHP